jgi:hypothetical protein
VPRILQAPSTSPNVGKSFNFADIYDSEIPFTRNFTPVKMDNGCCDNWNGESNSMVGTSEQDQAQVPCEDVVMLEKQKSCEHFLNIKRSMKRASGWDIMVFESGRWSCTDDEMLASASKIASLLLSSK